MGSPLHHLHRPLEGLLLELTSKNSGPGESLLQKKNLFAATRLRERPEVNWDFEKETGSSPNRALMTARVLKAGVLLRDSKLSLREVSEAVGLEDLNDFCKLFKKHYALTPWTYRKEISQMPDPFHSRM